MSNSSSAISDLVALREREVALEHIFEVVARGKPGEAVFTHPVRQSPDARVARTHARTAFAVVADEVRGLAIAIAQRIDLHVVDEHRAVLAQVAHQHAHRLVVAQRFAQRIELLLVAVFTLQHAQVLA